MKCPKGGCDYDTAADIDDAGDVSNHVKLLEVHCTYAHPPVGVQNAGGTGQLASRTARIQQPKVVVTWGFGRGTREYTGYLVPQTGGMQKT